LTMDGHRTILRESNSRERGRAMKEIINSKDWDVFEVLSMLVLQYQARYGGSKANAVKYIKQDLKIITWTPKSS
jgi:hypothetical protein